MCDDIIEMSNKKSTLAEKSLYDIHGYTDNELYDILDLVNPSDRELEAKILMMIHKYESGSTKSSQKLASFFDDIYNHFFDTDEEYDDAGEEGFEVDLDNGGNGVYTPGLSDTDESAAKYKLRDQEAGNTTTDTRAFQTTSTGIAATNAADPTKVAQPGNANNILSGNTPTEPAETQVGYTRDLGYSKGKLNPIMKQTTKRIISIDSQYRSDKRTMSTEFTFNLSEPLKDVVSLKLYSVQIPYTWYTIGKAYGNNFFYFKGRTPGIDTDTHDIKVEIEPGNYSPSGLIAEVNTSINLLKTSSSDISLGDTKLTYNSNTSLTLAEIELRKGYNESSYSVDMADSVSTYFGFTDNSYIPNTLRSSHGTYTPDTLFNITPLNNYFTVEVYNDDYVTLDTSFDVSINYGLNVTRTDTISRVNEAIQSKLLLTSSSAILNANYVDMTFNLNRRNSDIIVDENTKTRVIFYDQDHYNIDFTGSIFNITSQDISGNIGDDISGIFALDILPEFTSTTTSITSVPPEQLYFNIHMDLKNGTGTRITHAIRAYSKATVSYTDQTDIRTNMLRILQEYTDTDGRPIFAKSTITGSSLNLVVTATTPIWIGDTSCFNYSTASNNLDEIIGETPSAEQRGQYTILTKPTILLTSNIPEFADPFNNIEITLPNSPVDGSYTLNQYVDAINTGIRAYDTVNNNSLNGLSTAFDFSTPYPAGSHAYLQNDILKIFLNIKTVFDETKYVVDMNGSLFDTLGIMFDAPVPGDIFDKELLDLSKTYTKNVDTSNFAITADTIIMKIRPKRQDQTPIQDGNELDPVITLRLGDIGSRPQEFVDGEWKDNILPDNRQIDDILEYYITPVLQNYIDPISNIHIFKDISMSAVLDNNNTYGMTASFVIKKTLVAKNYNINFKDEFNTINSWSNNLQISSKMAGVDFGVVYNAGAPYIVDDQYSIIDSYVNSHTIATTEPSIDASGNILDINTGNILEANGTIVDIIKGTNVPITGAIIATFDDDGNLIISSESKFPSPIPFYIDNTNNMITIHATADGVATTTLQNDITLEIPSGEYFRDTLILKINSLIKNAPKTYTDITGTLCGLVAIRDEIHVTLTMNVVRSYETNDYDIVFYDKDSFVTCTAGASSVQNTTWDTTIGWIMGFREYTLYDLSAPDIVQTNVNSNKVLVKSDTGLSTNLYNYFLISLDDYNQNHLNDGLVTITNVDTSIPLPSYANRTEFVCDPVTKQKVFNVTTGLTEKQIYAAQTAANSASKTDSIGTSVSSNSYGSGPFVTDVFGLIPMKVSGLSNGSSYVEFGGTLQNQERSYFGPVNIQRMTVRLVTDRGNIVDLNNANWSFSLICEQLNKLEPQE